MTGRDPTLTALIKQVAEMKEEITNIQVQLAGEESKGKMPHPTIRLWDITDEERKAHAGQIRGWIEQIAEPLLGAHFPKCVTTHDEALVLLDVAMQMWRTFWLPERRTPKLLASQGEFLVRFWPAFREQIERIGRNCTCQVGYSYAAGAR